MAQRQQDAGLDGLDAPLDQPLVRGHSRACRQHRDVVVLRELAEARVELGLFAVGLVNAGLEVVDDPARGDATVVLQGAPVRHRPMTHALVGHRLGPGQLRVRQHGDEDLDIGLALSGAQRQRLAREVGQAPQPRLVVEAHLRLAALAAEAFGEQAAEKRL